MSIGRCTLLLIAVGTPALLGATGPGTGAQMSTPLRWGLAVIAIVLVVLLAVLVAMLVGSRRRPSRPARPLGAGGGPTLTPPASSYDKTRIAPSRPAAAATRLFVDLGMELVVLTGPDRDRRFPLHQSVTTIGRAGTRANDVELVDDTVSKEQAVIRYDGAGKSFTIENQSSTNPTSVDGGRVTGEQPLEPGVQISMGGTTLRFQRT